MQMIGKDNERVVIFDTTLRDGEQAPGCSMSQDEKLNIAHALAELKVDIIEAGFPASSRADQEAISAIANEINGPTICAMARCKRSDIEVAAESLRYADRSRIHVFISSSEIHREHKLKTTRDEIIRIAREGVHIAKDMCDEVQFSLEDASRTDREFLVQLAEIAIEAGATTINIADTVGYIVPFEFTELYRYLKANVRGIDGVTLATHCHDDLGMAVANSLAAVVGGARHVECTINGIGERAGNCSLEEIVMAIKTRGELLGVHTDIATSHLYSASLLVSDITEMPVPRNKAVVGENAFAHEAGIHQHAMLQHHSTYEILRPEDVGISGTNLVLGRHSGRHAFSARIQAMGYNVEPDVMESAFLYFKEVASSKKIVTGSDLESIMSKQNMLHRKNL